MIFNPTKTMKTYQYQIDIEEAVGSQTFEVKAASPEEALKKIKNGEGEIVAHDVEVQGLAWYSATLVDETDADC